MTHGYLMEVPLDDGENRLVVEIDPHDVSQDLDLAAPKLGEIHEKSRMSLESAFDNIGPGMQALVDKVREISPDEVTVEFGLKLAGQAGFVVARGTAEVNFVVKVTWKPPCQPTLPNP
jgi:Trypsin-co-occurring domain 1